MSSQSNRAKCVVCRKPVTREEGFKLSWDFEDPNLRELEDERCFCSIDCVDKWINNLGVTGLEKIMQMDGLVESQINRDTTMA